MTVLTTYPEYWIMLRKMFVLFSFFVVLPFCQTVASSSPSESGTITRNQTSTADGNNSQLSITSLAEAKLQARLKAGKLLPFQAYPPAPPSAPVSASQRSPVVSWPWPAAPSATSTVRSTTKRGSSVPNSNSDSQEFPVLQTAESHEDDQDDRIVNSNSKEDGSYGDGYNLGYKAGPGETGSFTSSTATRTQDVDTIPEASSSYAGESSYAKPQTYGSSTYSAPAPSYQDYGKSDYYNKPSYQPDNYAASASSYGSSYSGGYDDNRALLLALALKLRRMRERYDNLRDQQNSDSSQMGMLLAGLPFILGASSGSTGIGGMGSGLGLGNLFGK